MIAVVMPRLMKRLILSIIRLLILELFNYVSNQKAFTDSLRARRKSPCRFVPSSLPPQWRSQSHGSCPSKARLAFRQNIPLSEARPAARAAFGKTAARARHLRRTVAASSSPSVVNARSGPLLVPTLPGPLSLSLTLSPPRPDRLESTRAASLALPRHTIDRAVGPGRWNQPSELHQKA